MPVKLNLSGERFGNCVATVEAFPHPTRKARRWHCTCDCGTTFIACVSDLRCGGTKSCGCYHKMRAAEAATKHNLRGKWKSGPKGLYSLWLGIRSRCNNPNSGNYQNYGGRGIYVSPLWDDPAAFIRDMGPKPTPQHTLDRIDNDGPYSPENCRWATRKEQNNNKRSNRWVEAFGKNQTVPQWAEESGIPAPTIRRRLYDGWSPERAVSVSNKRTLVTQEQVRNNAQS